MDDVDLIEGAEPGLYIAINKRTGKRYEIRDTRHLPFEEQLACFEWLSEETILRFINYTDAELLAYIERKIPKYTSSRRASYMRFMYWCSFVHVIANNDVPVACMKSSILRYFVIAAKAAGVAG